MGEGGGGRKKKEVVTKEEGGSQERISSYFEKKNRKGKENATVGGRGMGGGASVMHGNSAFGKEKVLRGRRCWGERQP